MTMTPSRPGQVNSAGDARANFLEIFSGEVLEVFNERNVAMSRHRVRTIDSGKSATFDVVGKGGAQYHTPGTALSGTAVPHAKRTINIDDMLVADRFIADIDEAMLHYDVRAPYSRDIGRALAASFDKNVLQVMALASRGTAAVTGGNGGTKIVAATARTSAAVLIQACLDALQAMDEKDVPEEDRTIFLKPAQYSLLVGSGHDAINEDFGNAGNGSIASGKIFRLGGAEIVKTNNLPQTVVSTGPAAYQGTFTNIAALVCQVEAAGTVKLLDLSMQREDSVRHQGTLLVGRYAVGHGVLRPECSAEIAVV